MGGGQFTEKVIESYFLFKDEARLIDNFDSALAMVKKYQVQIDIDQLAVTEPVRIRKLLVKAYADQWIPQTENKDTRFVMMSEQVNKLSNKLQHQQFRGALWVGGSFANGKANGKYSDLDLYFGVGDMARDGDASKVIDGLEDVGIVVSDKSKAKRDVERIVRAGEGVGRINAMTDEGIDVDIHCLGNVDLQRIINLYPGRIIRLEDVEPYTQIRTNFIGHKREVKVDSTHIENYFAGEIPVKGIYLDNLSAGGVLVYEYKRFGTEITNNLWRAIVKGYLYHNKAYIRGSSGRVVGINQANAGFGEFLKTLYYQTPSSYSEERLRFLKTKYEDTLLEVSKMFDKF